MMPPCAGTGLGVRTAAWPQVYYDSAMMGWVFQACWVHTLIAPLPLARLSRAFKMCPQNRWHFLPPKVELNCPAVEYGSSEVTCFWWTECDRSDALGLLRRGHKKDSFRLTVSCRSQLPCHEDTEAAYREKLRCLISSQYLLASYGSNLPWKQISQP